MSVTDDRPFDIGLQPERTFLAWQRTVLALGAGCAFAVRFLAPEVGVIAIFAGIVGLGMAGAAYVGARFRYSRAHRGLRDTATLHTLSAWPLVVLAGSALILGVLAALFLWNGTFLVP